MESFDELSELMSEPPGGHNHGRRRGADGAWISLEIDTADAYASGYTVDPEEHAYRRPSKPADTIRHGTPAAYTNDECRCPLCREAHRRAAAAYRQRG